MSTAEIGFLISHSASNINLTIKGTTHSTSMLQRTPGCIVRVYAATQRDPTKIKGHPIFQYLEFALSVLSRLFLSFSQACSTKYVLTFYNRAPLDACRHLQWPIASGRLKNWLKCSPLGSHNLLRNLLFAKRDFGSNYKVLDGMQKATVTAAEEAFQFRCRSTQNQYNGSALIHKYPDDVLDLMSVPSFHVSLHLF
jgi:hypothetical protein